MKRSFHKYVSVNLNAAGPVPACRAEFIHGDGARVKRRNPARTGSIARKALSRRAARAAGFLGIARRCGCLSFASGSHADRPQDLAKRMRRDGGGPDILECRRKFRFARDRALHLVSGGRTRPVRGKFSRASFATSQKRGAKLPELLLGRQCGACPWNSRAEFLAAESSPKMKKLRIFLADTIDLQADFLVERLRSALPKMLAAAPPARTRGRSRSNSTALASSAQGCYALIDYVNFKGEGVLATERYHGRGWGLLQVLKGMSGASKARRRTNLRTRLRPSCASAWKILRRSAMSSDGCRAGSAGSQGIAGRRSLGDRAIAPASGRQRKTTSALPSAKSQSRAASRASRRKGVRETSGDSHQGAVALTRSPAGCEATGFRRSICAVTSFMRPQFLLGNFAPGRLQLARVIERKKAFLDAIARIRIVRHRPAQFPARGTKPPRGHIHKGRGIRRNWRGRFRRRCGSTDAGSRVRARGVTVDVSAGRGRIDGLFSCTFLGATKRRPPPPATAGGKRTADRHRLTNRSADLRSDGYDQFSFFSGGEIDRLDRLQIRARPPFPASGCDRSDW